MKFTFLSIFIVVMLQATSVINLSQIYQSVLSRYSNHYEPSKIKQLVQESSLGGQAAKVSKLDVRF